MTPAEHYAQAEQNLEMAKTSASGSVEETYFLGLAHVHATLATCHTESAYPAAIAERDALTARIKALCDAADETVMRATRLADGEPGVSTHVLRIALSPQEGT